MKLISFILLIILIIFGVTFAMLNSQTVTLNYYFGVRDLQLVVLLVCTFAMGAVVGYCLATPAMFRLRRAKSKLQSQIKQTEKNANKLLNG